LADESKDLVPAKSGADAALELAGIVSSLVPWLGGPISNVLGGISVDRKIGRVCEVLEGLAQGFQDFKSEASKEYVKTEDFEELSEYTLLRVIDERSEEKRRIYREFLIDAIKLPGEPYDDQMRFLRTLEEMQADHFKIMRALHQAPQMAEGLKEIEPTLRPTRPSFETLSRLLPDIPHQRLVDLIKHLNSMLLTELRDEDDCMGAHRLPNTITPYGRRFMKFITD